MALKGNKVVKEIKDGEEVLALFFPHTEADGVRFLTSDELPLQVGILDHKDGFETSLHKHMPVESNRTDFAHEWIYVEKGEMEITVANSDWKIIDTVLLKKGDSIMLLSGSHKACFKKGTRAIEIKQGPYPGKEKAKVILKDDESSGK